MQPQINPFAGDRPQDFAEERERDGVFRCDRCDAVWPLSFLVEEDDGARRVCRRDADEMAEIEANEIIANAVEAAGENVIVSLPFPVVPAFSGAVILQSVTPSSVVAHRGSGSAIIVLAGLNFSANIVTTPAANVTVSVSVDSAIQITLTISATGGATPGDYDLFFDGSALTPRRILKVR